MSKKGIAQGTERIIRCELTNRYMNTRPKKRGYFSNGLPTPRENPYSRKDIERSQTIGLTN